MSFEVGDKVRYVKAGPIGWEGRDWAVEAGCVLGQEYTVQAVDACGPSVRIEEDGDRFNLHPDHFELVTEEQPTVKVTPQLELYDGMRVAAYNLGIDPYDYRTIRKIDGRWVSLNDEGHTCAEGEEQIRAFFKDGEYKEITPPTTAVNPTPVPAGLPTDAATRKGIPIYSGFIAYFPDAIAAVAELSRIGNDQHNPGKPLHWDRSKSGDEMDALCRHMIDQAKGVEEDTDGVLHATKLAWRAMAHLQKLIESRS